MPILDAPPLRELGQRVNVIRPDYGEVPPANVATSASFSRSATATTDASAVPDGRLP
jgi:hypothetical protein